MKLIIDVPEEFYETIKTTLSYRFNYLEEKVRQATPLQAELEKIKAEITACTQQEEGEVPDCINYGIKLSTEIVEEHISELKGE